MSRTKRRKSYQMACLAACAGLLSSCGGSSDGGGSITSGDAPAHAYVASTSTLTTFSIDPSTGGLAASGIAPLTFEALVSLGGISQVAIDPSGQFLYLLHDSGIFAYSISRNTGALTAVAGSPFEPGYEYISLAFDASGTHFYTAGNDSPVAPVNTGLAAFSINGAGALAPLANYTVAGELSTIAAAGNYLYVAGFYTDSITVFSIGPSGALSLSVPGSPFTTDTGPRSIAVDPSGSVLYTANNGAPTAADGAPGSISGFTIDSATGALTPVAGNPLPIGVTGQISIDPTGKFLFVPVTNGVSVYAINTSTGVLTAIAGSPFTAGTNPVSVSVDPANGIVYVANQASGNVSEFSLGSNGVLTPLAGSPVPVGNTPTFIAIAPQ